jgi:hypothetical protein
VIFGIILLLGLLSFPLQVWWRLGRFARSGRGVDVMEVVPHPVHGRPWRVAFTLKFNHSLNATLLVHRRITVCFQKWDMSGVFLAQQVGGHGYDWLQLGSFVAFQRAPRAHVNAYAERCGAAWPSYRLKMDGTVERWFENELQRAAWERRHPAWM